MQNEPIMTPSEPRPRQIGSELETSEHVSHLGLIIGVLIVALALILIGLYVWSRMMIGANTPTLPQAERPSAAENNEPESTTAEAHAEILDVVSPSDELSAVEADLEATNLDDFENDLNAIDAELGKY